MFLIKEFIKSFKSWRISYVIGINDTIKRYARTKLGQFWLALSLAIQITTVGIVWSFLFKVNIHEYLPYLACSQLFWVFMFGVIENGTNIYINSSNYINSLNLHKLVYINSVFVKNITVLLHNLPVVLLVLIILNIKISFYSIIISLIGLTLTITFLFPIIIILSIFALRFRDIPNLVFSIMNILFYLTPVMWNISFLPEKVSKIIILNPFAVFLALSRDAILNIPIPNMYWGVAIIYIIISFSIASVVFKKLMNRISYWI